VYLRAAWAVRTGHDFYTVTDDNTWHYHYPPLLAVLLMPLADAPPGADPLPAAVPFAVSAALWYVFSLGCLAVAVHRLASALEATAAEPAVRQQPWGCRRWWALRVLPVVVCLPPIAGTLMRGQVNLLLMLLLCEMLAALVRRRSWQAGLWLAGAVCLKVIPAFLIVYPLWKRDWRCLAGCSGGLVVGLGLIPAAVLGPGRTLACYREWADVLVRPALAEGQDHSRDKELIGATSTDSQSFEAVLHNTLHLDRDTRPLEYALQTKLLHWLIGGALTGLTLLVLGRRCACPRDLLLGVGALTLLMLLLSPVCHLHYFCLALPLVAGLLLTLWERQGGPARGAAHILRGLLVLNVVANTLPHVPGLELTRDLGLATYQALLLWLGAVVVLAIAGRPRPAAVSVERRVRMAG
jgi:alpha-1,2-mannosyltransferase